MLFNIQETRGEGKGSHSKTAKVAHAAVTQCIIKILESAAAVDAILRERGAMRSREANQTRNQDPDEKAEEESCATLGQSMPIQTKSQLRLALNFAREDYLIPGPTGQAGGDELPQSKLASELESEWIYR